MTFPEYQVERVRLERTNGKSTIPRERNKRKEGNYLERNAARLFVKSSISKASAMFATRQLVVSLLQEKLRKRCLAMMQMPSKNNIANERRGAHQVDHVLLRESGWRESFSFHSMIIHLGLHSLDNRLTQSLSILCE